MQTRIRQPYKRKTVTRGGALIFGIGFGALLAILAIVIGIAIPSVSTRLQNLPYYVRTYYNKLVPHPEYLPTPDTTTAAIVISVQDNPAVDPSIQNVPEDDVSPTELQNQASPLPEVTVNISAGENLLLSKPSGEVTLQPIGNNVQLTNLAHQWQTWNNCGPATISTNMSYFGHLETQVEAALFLKPNPDDKNVSPYELAAYARTTGLGAIVRQGGTVEQLKRFLSNDLPILTETWLVHDGDGLGHYRLMTGYNDVTGEFSTSDSLSGPDHTVSYEQFDADWRVFNRLYVLVFPPEQADIVSSIIGENLDDVVMYGRLIDLAQAEIESNPENSSAYFNLGEALSRLGRYEEAVLAFDESRRLGLHWRRLWYQFTPFEAYYAMGRYKDVLDLTEATLQGTGGLEEAYYYQGLSLHAIGQPGAEQAFQNAITYNANFIPAQEALRILTESQ